MIVDKPIFTPRMGMPPATVGTEPTADGPILTPRAALPAKKIKMPATGLNVAAIAMGQPLSDAGNGDAPVFTHRTLARKLADEPGNPSPAVDSTNPIFTHRTLARKAAESTETTALAPAQASAAILAASGPDAPTWRSFPTTKQVDLPSAGEVPVFVMTTQNDDGSASEDDDDADAGLPQVGSESDATNEAALDAVAAAAAAAAEEQAEAEKKSKELIDEMLAKDLQVALDEEASRALIEGGENDKITKSKKAPMTSKRAGGSSSATTSPDKTTSKAIMSKAGSGKSKAKKSVKGKKSKSSKSVVDVEVRNDEGELLSSKTASFSAKDLKLSMEKLILPLLITEYSVESLGAAHLTVNGQSAEGNAIASRLLSMTEASNRVIIKLDQRGSADEPVVDALHLAQGEAAFVVDLCDGAGQLIASSGAILTKSWLNKSLIKAAVEPALKQAGIYQGGIYHGGDGSKHVAKILIDDKIVHGKAKAATFVQVSGGNGVRVKVELKADSVPTFFDVDLVDLSGELLAQMSTTLSSTQLEKAIGPALVQPALESVNVYPMPPIGHIKAVIQHADGANNVLDMEQLLKMKASKLLLVLRASTSFDCGRNATDPIKVVVTLPPGVTPVERLPTSVAVTLSHQNHAIATMDAELTLKSLDDPILTALIKPAIAAHLRNAGLDGFAACHFRALLNKDGARHVTASINGMDVSLDASLRAIAPAAISAEDGSHIVIHLPDPNIGAINAPPVSLVPFHVTIAVTPPGDSLAEPEKVELETWLQKAHLQQPLLESLVKPALALYSLDASDFLESILVDGVADNATSHATVFARAYGRPVQVTIHGSKLPGGSSHLADFLSESELARRSMPLHASAGTPPHGEHVSSGALGAQLNKAKDAVASGVSTALKKLSLSSGSPPDGGKSTGNGSQFIVHIEGTFNDGETWSETFDTKLNAMWLKKPVAVALVEPALGMYYVSEHFARRQTGGEKVPFANVRVTINGSELDENALTCMTPSYFVYSDATPSEMKLSFIAGF